MDYRVDLYFADVGNSRIRAVKSDTGVITTVAGGGTDEIGDGGPATLATFSSHPMRVALDKNGNMYIADAHQNRIRIIDTSNNINTLAGNGYPCCSGDGGKATEASINSPHGISIDSSGNVFIADLKNHRVRKVSSNNGIITTVVGTGKAGIYGDGGLAEAAELNSPISVSLDKNENLYITDHGNSCVRRVDSNSGRITTVAGIGKSGFLGDGKLATESALNRPRDVSIDMDGNVFIADGGNNRIRRIDSTSGIITTVAGNGEDKYDGDDKLAISASISHPYSITLDKDNNIFLTDTGSNRIRKITNTGIITTVAGNGNYGFSGDSGPAKLASIAIGKNPSK